MEVYKREREEIPLDWLAVGERVGGMKREQRREQKRTIKWEGTAVVMNAEAETEVEGEWTNEEMKKEKEDEWNERWSLNYER